MSSKAEPVSVVVTDVQVSFQSMVVLMVKWSLAAIPAFLILLTTALLFLVAVSGALLSHFRSGLFG